MNRQTTESPMSLDKEETWPVPLRELLETSLPLLSQYEHARAEWDERIKTDIIARATLSANPYASDREAILSECDAIVRMVTLVGYHCTRLHDGEIQDIQSEGMRPCSPALAEARICRAIAASVMDPDIADKLRAAAVAHQPGRSEKTYFIFTADVLLDESGVWNLLRFWGGEAIYWAHKDNAQLGAALMNIGQPCIIEAAVPADEIETYCSVGERVMRTWLERRGIRTGHGGEMEGHIKSALPASHILRVIRRTDSDFVRLTNCNRWRKPLI